MRQEVNIVKEKDSGGGRYFYEMKRIRKSQDAGPRGRRFGRR